MNRRIQYLKEQSSNAKPHICVERARLLTDFYIDNEGKFSTVELRARSFEHLCKYKTLYLGKDELIVGERGCAPKATPTYPELTCHSSDDLKVINTREKTNYAVSKQVFSSYEKLIIPYWKTRNLRGQIFDSLSTQWKQAYESGVFTEFMEQRAPGHTVADGKIYKMGMRDFKEKITVSKQQLRTSDKLYKHKINQLTAMEIAADSLIAFAKRHADLALTLAKDETEQRRKEELQKIASVCNNVPENPPRDFQEALQMYWFCHLAVITELNGWDAFSPGHLDRHLEPFYIEGIKDKTLTREKAKELLCCFFIKFNNHPAPPKVGVTAAESGTYTDFANINLAGQTIDGQDGCGEVSFLLLEVIDELHLLQPSQNVQISHVTKDKFLIEACRVIRKGYGYPSVFNSDIVVKEMLRMGKSIEDAREGGTSGCVETGAFGKEAYILTGYLNLPKLLELALNNGFDSGKQKQLGPRTGDTKSFATIDDVFDAWEKQLHYFLEIKIAGNKIIEQFYAKKMPAPFLSLITDDCIEKGLDYNEGGARYNTSYIQGVGIGTLTDSFAALKKHVFDDKRFSLEQIVDSQNNNFANEPKLQGFLKNKSPKWGCDNDAADMFMNKAFDAFFDKVDGLETSTGGLCCINMLPTTCHIYFGRVTGATPDGRLAHTPLSEGISPVQGMDDQGPTAILLSAAKMNHEKTGGTLLNMKFLPQVLQGSDGLEKLAHLIRTYFKMGGHHIQFNVVDSHTLKHAQKDPDSYRGLIVRVAGYSDYFCDISTELQNEIISRTSQE